jgi:hypothetical protein
LGGCKGAHYIELLITAQALFNEYRLFDRARSYFC